MFIVSLVDGPDQSLLSRHLAVQQGGGVTPRLRSNKMPARRYPESILVSLTVTVFETRLNAVRSADFPRETAAATRPPRGQTAGIRRGGISKSRLSARAGAAFAVSAEGERIRQAGNGPHPLVGSGARERSGDSPRGAARGDAAVVEWAVAERWDVPSVARSGAPARTCSSRGPGAVAVRDAHGPRSPAEGYRRWTAQPFWARSACPR